MTTRSNHVIDPAELPPEETEEEPKENEITDPDLNPEIRDNVDQVDENEERSSGRLEESFLNFQAWRKEMLANPQAAAENFSGSKAAFMQECKKFYPNEFQAFSEEMAATEILKSRTRLEGLDEIPNLTAELQKTARNISPELQTNRVEMIREINRVLEATSRSVQQLLIEYPGEEFDIGSQLDQCFMEMYRLELLKEQLERNLTEEEKAALASGTPEAPKGGKEPAPGESYEEFKERIEKELKNNWQRLLEGQFQMDVDTWFSQNMPGDPDWTMFGADKEKWERLKNGLDNIKRKYLVDERLSTVKDFEYKAELNELLGAL